jgi:alkyl sulfatase BDS1-like metallo-beta-lactamase superfamily hydrolase
MNLCSALIRWSATAILLSSAALAAAPSADQAAKATLAADTRDIDFAHRGFVATLADPVIRTAGGRAVWNLSARDFLHATTAPATVNPLLWRESQLMALNGLFQVTDHIWQVRGFDVANTTFVAGAHGWIVIDTLGSTETAKAALDLVNQKLGARPIIAVIYTHPHADHFGGAGGMITAQDAKSGKVQVIAPKGFLAAAIGENVIAGPAMQRRAIYQFGVTLPTSPTGQVGDGIGPGIALGTPSLIAPNHDVDHTGQTLTIDGVRMVFQFTRGTEAPVEMNIDFPDWHVIDMAENANATQHNILTPRGAVVRDAKAWADDLTESLQLFGDSDILITSHGWPRFGRAYIDDYLAKQRDYYAFLHDQTVRLMNDGLTGDAIAARLRLPAPLAQEWYDQPFYGSLSFNSRAVYQYYMGWYDANPVHLAPLPPDEAGRRYVQALGGAAKVQALANSAVKSGDLTWAAELLNRAVFADPTNKAAKALLAQCYDRLGWAAETSTWRNMYLTAAKELRQGSPPPVPRSLGFLAGLPTDDLFNLLAVRLDADKAEGADLKLQVAFTDTNETTYVTVKNGVLIHLPGKAPGPVDATLSLTRAQFIARAFGGQQASSGTAPFDRFFSLIDTPPTNFPIVTPPAD